MPVLLLLISYHLDSPWGKCLSEGMVHEREKVEGYERHRGCRGRRGYAECHAMLLYVQTSQLGEPHTSLSFSTLQYLSWMGIGSLGRVLGAYIR